MSYKYLNITNMSFVNVFFRQVNTLIDWSSIEKKLRKVYKRGEKQSKTNTNTFIDRFALSSMHIDGDDALYLLLKLRRPAEALNQIFWTGGQTLDNSHTARFYALLYSPDITVAMPVFQLYQITDPNATTPEEGTQHRALVEVNSGNNDRHVTPVIGPWEYKSNHPDEWAKNYDFSVYIPQKNTENDSLNLGQKILIDVGW